MHVTYFRYVSVALRLAGATLIVAGLGGMGGGADSSVGGSVRSSRDPAMTVQPSDENGAHRNASIESVQVGQRVPAWNPELNAAEHDQPDPDAATWRKLTLRMAKGDGGRLDIFLLRPLEWIDQTGAYPGQVINLDLPELGAQGDAEVLALAPCPEIRPGQGRVVTGTFAHEVADNVFDVVLTDGATGQQRDRIGATGVHPFWSETRQAFVPAAELTVGEEVLAITGDRLRVASLLHRPGPERVYNLEVDGEHVYYVGASGTLVHNNYATGAFGENIKGYLATGNRSLVNGEFRVSVPWLHKTEHSEGLRALTSEFERQALASGASSLRITIAGFKEARQPQIELAARRFGYAITQVGGLLHFRKGLLP